MKNFEEKEMKLYESLKVKKKFLITLKKIDNKNIILSNIALRSNVF